MNAAQHLMMQEEIKRTLTALTGLLESYKEYKDEDVLMFYRRKYDGRGYSQWRIVLDSSKSVWSVRTAAGFATYPKEENDQTIFAPANLKEQFLCKDKKSRELIQIMLDQIAEKKYGED